jgi:lipoprotein NlpD
MIQQFAKSSWLKILSVLFSLLCVACSATKPAPIKDQTSKANKAPAVVVPNWSVTKSSEAEVSKSKPATKPKPAEESKPAQQQAKPAANNPPPQTYDPVTDSNFRIGKPSNANMLDTYNGSTNKGIDFGGKMGDPVNAAADGKVIFSGNSLRSYGNLVIVKHNNSYITIYAHNSKNLVKEGDAVRRGQKIAEMGNTEADRVKLHFELRRDSKPVDPTGFFDN